MRQRAIAFFLFTTSLSVLASGCALDDAEPEAASAESALVGDVSSMTQNPDGTFRVRRKDGTTSDVTADDL